MAFLLNEKKKLCVLYIRMLYTRLNRPFGGVVVVMGGDFRQVLPVIPKGAELK